MRYTSFFSQRVTRIAAPKAVSSALLTSESASQPLGSHSSGLPPDINVLNNIKKTSESLSSQSQLAIETFVSMVRRLQNEKEKQLMKHLENASVNPSHLSLAEKRKTVKNLRIRAIKARLQIAKKRMIRLSSNKKDSKDNEIVLEQQLEKALEDERREELMLSEEKKKILLEKKALLKKRKDEILEKKKAQLKRLKEKKKRPLEEQVRARRLRMELTAFKVFEKLIERFQIQRFKEVQNGIRIFQNQELAEAKVAAAEAEEKAKALKAVNRKEKNVLSSPATVARSSSAPVKVVNENVVAPGKKKGQLLELNENSSARSLSSSKNEEEKKISDQNIAGSIEEKALELAKKRIQRLKALTNSDPGKQNDSKTVEKKVKQLLKVSLLLKKTAASLRSPIEKKVEEEQDGKALKASSLKKSKGSDKNDNSEGSKSTLQHTSSLTETIASEKEKAFIGAESLKTKAVKKIRADSPGSDSAAALSQSAVMRSSSSSPSDTAKFLSIPKKNKTSIVEKKTTVVPAALQVKRMVKKIASPPVRSASPEVFLTPNPVSVPHQRETDNGETAFRVDNARREYFTLLEQEKERKFAIAAAERSGASAALPNVRRADLSWAVPVGSGGLFRL